MDEINTANAIEIIQTATRLEDETDEVLALRVLDIINDTTLDKIGFLELVKNKDTPIGSSNIRQITTTELPADRLFRSAWDDSNPENFVGIDLAKAQLISHGLRRDDRQVKLAPLDTEVSFVGTTASRKTAINTERTAIMDANAIVQTDIDSAADEAELRSVLTVAGIGA